MRTHHLLASPTDPWKFKLTRTIHSGFSAHSALVACALQHASGSRTSRALRPRDCVSANFHVVAQRIMVALKTSSIRLHAIVHARTWDKGNHSNICVFAYKLALTVVLAAEFVLHAGEKPCLIENAVSLPAKAVRA